MKAPLPPDEDDRLAILNKYKVLDSVPEKSFDEMTFLASYICQAPIALVSFIDKDRQWFKSNRGLSVSETSREVSFCAHAILNRELLIVSDTLKDDRFARNPLVLSEPKIRFYAGEPFYSREGSPLGTLCVIDRAPRELSAEQRKALGALSRQVGTQLELRRNLIELNQALDTIKVLSGIIPVCASCKSIRDDQGNWNDLGTYLEKHSEAQLSHGLCPECTRRLYPEIMGES